MGVASTAWRSLRYPETLPPYQTHALAHTLNGFLQLGNHETHAVPLSAEIVPKWPGQGSR